MSLEPHFRREFAWYPTTPSVLIICNVSISHSLEEMNTSNNTGPSVIEVKHRIQFWKQEHEKLLNLLHHHHIDGLNALSQDHWASIDDGEGVREGPTSNIQSHVLDVS